MRRIDKVNSQIHRILAEIIQKEVDDPNLGMISIVAVDTSKDLRYCKVYFSVLPEENLQLARQTLSKMKNFIKKQLSLQLRAKFLPDIGFIPDESIKYSIDISKKIDEINKERE